MPFRNAFDKLTLGRSKGRRQGDDQPAGDLAMGSEGPAEPATTPPLPDPSTPGGSRRALLPQLVARNQTPTAATLSITNTFSRDELASLSKFPTPRLPTDSPPLRVTPAHMSSRLFRELASTEPPPPFGLYHGAIERAAGQPDDEAAAYGGSAERIGWLGSEEGIGLGISFDKTTLPAGPSTSELPMRRHRNGDPPPPMLPSAQYQRSDGAEGQRNREDRPREEHLVAHGDMSFLEGSSERLETLQQWSADDNDDPTEPAP
ncbi:hypothetical protein MMC30_006114 [Trapelia coarctata]|nr:hypothetical protein [Trapelia coarctata]